MLISFLLSLIPSFLPSLSLSRSPPPPLHGIVGPPDAYFDRELKGLLKVHHDAQKSSPLPRQLLERVLLSCNLQHSSWILEEGTERTERSDNSSRPPVQRVKPGRILVGMETTAASDVLLRALRSVNI